MAEDNTLDGGVKTDEDRAETSHSAVINSENEPEKVSNEQDTSKRKEESTNTVPYYKLFSFADSLDYLLIFVGTVGAIGNGMSLPLMTVIFGNLINSFGDFADTKELVHQVSKVV